MKSQLLTLLIKAFKYKVIDTNEFLLIIDAGHIRCSIAYYKRHVESGVAVINGVCYCCGLFVSSSSLVVVLRSDPVIVIALDKDTINIAFFDYYDREIIKYWFCYLCFNILNQKKVPKFSFINEVNIVICQDYLPTLKILILVEEMLIT